jgi:hypothetical protein
MKRKPSGYREVLPDGYSMMKAGEEGDPKRYNPALTKVFRCSPPLGKLDASGYLLRQGVPREFGDPPRCHFHWGYEERMNRASPGGRPG